MQVLSGITTSIIFIACVAICLSIYFIVDYKRLKIEELNKQKNFFTEINTEKKRSEKLKNSATEVEHNNNKTQLKLNKLKVNILNIGFSFSEIFK